MKNKLEKNNNAKTTKNDETHKDNKNKLEKKEKERERKLKLPFSFYANSIGYAAPITTPNAPLLRRSPRASDDLH